MLIILQSCEKNEKKNMKNPDSKFVIIYPLANVD